MLLCVESGVVRGECDSGSVTPAAEACDCGDALCVYIIAGTGSVRWWFRHQGGAFPETVHGSKYLNYSHIIYLKSLLWLYVKFNDKLNNIKSSLFSIIISSYDGAKKESRIDNINCLINQRNYCNVIIEAMSTNFTVSSIPKAQSATVWQWKQHTTNSQTKAWKKA